MAKRKKPSLPSVTKPGAIFETKPGEKLILNKIDEQPAKDEPAIEEPSSEMPVRMAKLELPIAELKHGYEPRRCDVQKLTGKQREALRRLTNGLEAQGAKLEGGRIVSRPQDAIKWILEALAR